MTEDAVKLAREVLALSEKATEGPCHSRGTPFYQIVANAEYCLSVCEKAEDARFFAHARTAAPALARAVLAMQWRPIAEADKTGNIALLFKPDSRRSGASVFVGYWDDRANGWMPVYGWSVVEPTHFLPLSALPPPPKE